MLSALQVAEIAGRVAQLRADVPRLLSEYFKARLEACRPMPQDTEPDAVAEQLGAGVMSAALSPAPAELRSKLSDAATQMPMLR